MITDHRITSAESTSYPDVINVRVGMNEKSRDNFSLYVVEFNHLVAILFQI